MTARPLLIPFAGVEPRFGGPVSAGAASAVLGRATLGADAVLGARAVIRADGHFVRAGDGFRLGPRSTVHIAHDRYPAIVGDRVAVGTNAVIHACTIGSDCVLEDDVIVLDGSVLGDRVVLEAGAVAFPRSSLPEGFVYGGSPAKPVRAVEPGEIEARTARLALEPLDEAEPAVGEDAVLHPSVFVARTARVRGRVRADENASVFFSCDLDAREAEIAVGANTNIQDNTVIHATGGAVAIGHDTTIGHNVRIETATVGAGVLLGIGSVVAPGTVVEDDVLLAAGAHTSPGQVLEGGWLWGGRPARRLSRLDQGRRDTFAWIIRAYRQYARDYAGAQETIRG